VSTWLNIATFPVCLAVSAVGVVLSVITWRKKGPRSGIRGIAWSLLPIAAWLIHAIGLIGRLGSAIVNFATSFVFSPETWLGVIVLGLSVLLFLISGGIPMFQPGSRKKAAKASRAKGAEAGGQEHAAIPAKSDRSAVSAPDDDLSDIQEILRKHGIN